MKKMFFATIVLIIVCSFSASAFAADQEWTGGTSTAWSLPANWNSGAGPVPNAGDGVIFDNAGSGNTAISLAGGTTEIGNLVFQANPAVYTIGSPGNVLSIANGGYIQINGGPNNQTVQADVALDNTNPNASFGNYGGAGVMLAVSGNVMGSTAVGSGSLTLQGTNTSANLVSGIISNGTGTGKIGVIKNEAGTWVLSGANTYSGGTTINAGTLQIGNSSALGTGAVTNNATLSIGTTNLSGIGVYTQNAGSALNLTANSSSSFGSVTSGVAAVINAGSTVNVAVGGYIPNNSTLEIVNDAGLGAAPFTPTVNTINSQYVTFSGSSPDGNLYLVADRSANGFASTATNSNAEAVGYVLDNVTNAGSDMSNVLNTLENASPNEVSAGLNTLTPIVDNGIPDAEKRTQGQFVSTIMSHLSSDNRRTDQQDGFGVRTFSGSSTVTGQGGYDNTQTAQTGISTGSESNKLGLDVWADGFGSYLHEDPRGLSNGYNATIWGSALGIEADYSPLLRGNVSFMDFFRIGAAGCFAQDFIRSKDNSGQADINSGQAALYWTFGKEETYYINTALSFAYNTYDLSRQIAVVGINRIATADFCNGMQYLAYIEGGYMLNIIKNFQITPIASFEYLNLYVPSYTETGAGDLDLKVNFQDYNMLQTGIGIKLGYPINFKEGSMLPELKFRWLYDFIGDNQQAVAAFTGGGASFSTIGFRPAQSSYDLGVRLTIFTKYDVTFALNYDLELEKDFYAHYGYMNVNYNF
jgi:autotransporter-associated beta strand protein